MTKPTLIPHTSLNPPTVTSLTELCTNQGTSPPTAARCNSHSTTFACRSLYRISTCCSSHGSAQPGFKRPSLVSNDLWYKSNRVTHSMHHSKPTSLSAINILSVHRQSHTQKTQKPLRHQQHVISQQFAVDINDRPPPWRHQPCLQPRTIPAHQVTACPHHMIQPLSCCCHDAIGRLAGRCLAQKPACRTTPTCQGPATLPSACCTCTTLWGSRPPPHAALSSHARPALHLAHVPVQALPHCVEPVTAGVGLSSH